MQGVKRAKTPQPAPPARAPSRVRVTRELDSEPRLPHELDESSDSQVQGPPDTQAIGKRAYDDVQAGRVDTDRGPVLERLGRTMGPAPPTPTPRKGRGAR